jgi:SAM-dependent methyltransferase
MGGFTETVRKEWYRLSEARRLATTEWNARYWREEDDARIVACRQCPKFDATKEVCSVPFGSPIRKCTVASIESHLRGTRGMTTLEIGYGRRSLAKQVVELSGGSWTGLEPSLDPGRKVEIGDGGYGHVASIPFDRETFDFVFGIHSFEHWEEAHPHIPVPSAYDSCLREVWRVLKPGGSIYFDAPIHLHGHEMFIVGDIPKIRRLFDDTLWGNVVLEKWRYDHEPLPAYPAPENDVRNWPKHITNRTEGEAGTKVTSSVWLLTLTARKRN